MSNFHRLTWIDLQIRGGKYPNCRQIAAQFEISPRQAARDIEYLRDTMGAPLKYIAQHNGYQYSEPTYTLPAQLVTESDQKLLSYLAYQYQNSSSARAAQLAELFERLAGRAAMDSETAGGLPVYQVKPKEASIFTNLRQAISSQTKVELYYCNVKGETSRRIVAPYKLFVRAGARYVVGYCELRAELRVFRLDRIKACTVLQARFIVSPLFDPADYKDTEPFKIYDPYQTVIRFDQPIVPEMLELPLETVADLTYRITFYQASELLNILLTLPGSFKIISPNWLIEKLKRKLERIYRNNFGPDERD